MKPVLVALLAGCAAATPAAAFEIKKVTIEQPSYDRKLEQAAARIVAARMGDIRGAFSPGDRLVFVLSPDWRPFPARLAMPVEPVSITGRGLLRAGDL
jgi:hypothetical protein